MLEYSVLTKSTHNISSLYFPLLEQVSNFLSNFSKTSLFEKKYFPHKNIQNNETRCFAEH